MTSVGRLHYHHQMTQTVLIHVFSSFVIAGLWIAGATLLAERLGSRLGGLIANLPSNIVISYIFIALSGDIGYAASATSAVPVGMLVDTVFLLVLILALAHGIVTAVLLSLVSWAALAWVAARVSVSAILITVPAYLLVTILVWLFLEYGRQLPAAERMQTTFSWRGLLIRAAFAGSVVAATVLLSHFLPPYWVGLISTFPAVLLSSMVILTVSQGPAFARATGKVLVLSSTNIVVYAMVIRWAYPAWGIWAGTLVGFAAALACVAVIRSLLDRISR